MSTCHILLNYCVILCLFILYCSNTSVILLTLVSYYSNTCFILLTLVSYCSNTCFILLKQLFKTCFILLKHLSLLELLSIFNYRMQVLMFSNIWSFYIYLSHIAQTLVSIAQSLSLTAPTIISYCSNTCLILPNHYPLLLQQLSHIAQTLVSYCSNTCLILLQLSYIAQILVSYC